MAKKISNLGLYMTQNYGLSIVKDYPIKGVNFIDINGLLEKPQCFKAVIDKFCEEIKKSVPAEVLAKAAIISTEARGFLFSTPVAYQLGLPILTIRKKGKIPNNPYRFHITNEYTSYDMEMDGDLLNKHDNLIYIDDIFATGQTVAAVKKAVEEKGKKMLLAVHLTAVKELEGMRKENPTLQDLPTVEII